MVVTKLLLLCQFALAFGAASRVVWNVSVFPSQTVQYAANSSTVVLSNGTVIEGRDAQTGALKYSLKVTGFSYISNELILMQNGSFLYAHEVETGAHRYGNPFSDKIEHAVVLGHYFMIWANNNLWGCTTDIGAMWWKKKNVTNVSGLTYCGPRRVCVQSDQGIMAIDVWTGIVLWGPNPNITFTTSRAFLPISEDEGRLAVASGGFLDMNQVILLNSNTGDVIWNVSLGANKCVTDLLINNNLLAVTYLNIDMPHKNNAYPSSGKALNLTDGRPLFGYGPKGTTMGGSQFLSNGNIVYIGDEAIMAVDGKTGSVVCALTDNVQDYNQYAVPAVLGTRFFATYYQMQSGYHKEQFVALEC